MQKNNEWHELFLAPDHPFYSLLTAAPLSAALRKIYQTINIQVLMQQLTAATAEEQQLLDIVEENSWIREVHIIGDGAPRVLARTVIPFHIYQHFKPILDNLHNNFLGEGFLYKIPHRRSHFEYAQQRDQWIRRSVFYLQADRLVVSELFL